jgi:hypothetical protein
VKLLTSREIIHEISTRGKGKPQVFGHPVGKHNQLVRGIFGFVTVRYCQDDSRRHPKIIQAYNTDKILEYQHLRSDMMLEPFRFIHGSLQKPAHLALDHVLYIRHKGLRADGLCHETSVVRVCRAHAHHGRELFPPHELACKIEGRPVGNVRTLALE